MRQLYEIKLNKYQGPYPDTPPPRDGEVLQSPAGTVFKGKTTLDTTQISVESQKSVCQSGVDGNQCNLVVTLLPNNLDVRVSKAERLFYDCKFQSCLRLTEE